MLRVRKTASSIVTGEQPVVRASMPVIPADYDRLELLYEIQTVLAQPGGIEDTCDALLPIVTRAVSVRTATLVDVDGDSVRVLMWAAPGVTPAAMDEARDRALEAVAEHVRLDPTSLNLVSRTALLREGVAELASPQRNFADFALSLDGEHVFGVFQLEGVVPFNEHDRLFINAVSSPISAALERHHARRSLEAARREAEQANRRLTDAQAIAKSALEGSTLDESLSASLGALCTRLRADVAAVLVAPANGEHLRRQASIGFASSHEADGIEAVATGRIAASETAMILDDLDDASGLPRGISALLGAPMRTRDHLVGVVYVASRGQRVFTDDELQFLELVADRMGTIIDNATLYDRALSALRSRDAVMATVSHDLTTPLSTIQMCTELLGKDGPRSARPVSLIKSSVEVMSRLIGDLRDVQSIEAGHLSIKMGSHDACVLVRDAVDGIRAIAARKTIGLDVRLPPRALELECDRIRVVQILTNLLSNAIKFTPQSGSITVSLAEDANRAVFSVADTGCGISETDLPYVYERYWQARETAGSYLGTGLGLGLAIAKGIVDAHRGTISVVSRLGRGTTFSFALPITHGSKRAGAPAMRTRPDARPSARVLVVDDEPNALAALAALLEEQGLIVDQASDGLQALARVQQRAPDVLIVDVEMPGLRGPELVRKVRQGLPELPVILMTGYRDHDIASTQQELRAGYVGKPVDIAELVTAIYRELDRR